MSDLGNKEVMSKNIQYYMNLHNKSRSEICSDLGFKYSTFSDWFKGNVYPRIDKIEMMANYFKINKSDLIEDKKSNKIKPENPNNYFLEQYINTFGYEITGDYSEGYIFLETPTAEYELEDGDLDDLYNSTETFIKFKLSEIMGKRKKISKNYSLEPLAAHANEGSTQEDIKHDIDIMNDNTQW